MSTLTANEFFDSAVVKPLSADEFFDQAIEAPNEARLPEPSFRETLKTTASILKGVGSSQQRPDPDRSVLGELGIGLERGFLGSIEAVGGLSQFAATLGRKLTGDNIITKFLDDYGQITADIAGAAKEAGFPRSRDDNLFSARSIAGGVGEAIPQILPQVGLAVATGGSSLPVQVAIFTGTAGAQVVGSQFNEARAYHIGQGLSPEEAADKAAIEASTAGVITAATNAIPGVAILRKVPGGQTILNKTARGILGSLSRTTAAGGAEAIQEVSEQVLTDAAASIQRDDPTLWDKIFNADPEYWRSVGFAGVVGGITGGAAKVAIELTVPTDPTRPAFKNAGLDVGKDGEFRTQQARLEFLKLPEDQRIARLEAIEIEQKGETDGTARTQPETAQADRSTPQAQATAEAQAPAQAGEEIDAQTQQEQITQQQERLPEPDEGRPDAPVLQDDPLPDVASTSTRDLATTGKQRYGIKGLGGKTKTAVLREVIEARAPEQAVPPQTPDSDIPVAQSDEPIGDLIDQWLGERQLAETRAEVAARVHEEEASAIVGEKRFDETSKELVKAIHLYIDLKGKPDQIGKYRDQLTEEQIAIHERSQNLTPEELVLAETIRKENTQLGLQALDEEVISNYYENYTARLWRQDIKAERTPGKAKFTTTTGRSKQRTLESILHGWAIGKELAIEGAVSAQMLARQQVAQVIHDRNLIKLASKAKLISTNQNEGFVRLEHPNFVKWEFAGNVEVDLNERVEIGKFVRPEGGVRVGKVIDIDGTRTTVHFQNNKKNIQSTKAFKTSDLEGRIVKPRGKNFFITDDGKIMERRALYADPVLGKKLNKILGTSKLKGVPGIDTITKYNAIIKQTVLFTSLFHHQAFLRSFMLGGRAGGGTLSAPLSLMSRGQAFEEGRQAIRNFGPEVQDLVRGGLTIGKIQDWDEMALQDATIVGKVIDKVQMTKAAKDSIIRLRDRTTKFLFNELGPSLKVQAGLIEYRALLNKHEQDLADGTITRHDLAKRVANLMNDDFGGLNLQRIGRDPTLQHVFQLLALAPDWTESNVRSMAKAFKSGEEGTMYREFWMRIAAKGMGATILFNLLVAGLDDEDFFERYKNQWDEGHLRWLEVDITPIYRALEGEDDKRKYFSLIGHFRDPLKFILHPFVSAKHKSSILGRMVFEAGTGTNWQGKKFTTFAELIGVDDKGRYKISKRGSFRRGQKKGGRLAGQTVAWKFGGAGPIQHTQIPSYLLHETRGAMPIQVQNLMAWLAGEMDGFDAITKGLGLMTATSRPKEKKKR